MWLLNTGDHMGRFDCTQMWLNCPCGVMISILASNVEDRRYMYEPRVVQSYVYKIGICCFYTKYSALRRRSTDWLAHNPDNVSEWGDISADFCFSELALENSNVACWSSTMLTTSSFYWKWTCSRHDIAEKLLSWR